MYFFDNLASRGDRVALIDAAGVDVTYADLSYTLANRAAQIGCSPKLVFIESNNSVDCVTWILACLFGRHPVIIGGADSRESLQGLFCVDASIDAEGNLVDYGSDTGMLCHADLALMLSTSGSTGATKLVRLSRDAIAANAASIATYLELGAQDRAITTLPLGYSYGLSVVLSHLHAGASIVLTDRSVVDDGFWALFEDTKATSFAGVPYTYELLEAHHFRAHAPASLRTLTQAGGRLEEGLARQYANWARSRGIRFFTMYGQTEATARIAYLPPEAWPKYAGCIGKAIPGGTLRVADENGASVARGMPGELVYTGPNVMMGYACDASDLAGAPSLAELRTGDLGVEVDEDIFKIVGRMSRFSKIAGLRIDLDQIERHLREAGIAAVVAGNDQLVSIGILEGADIEKADHVVADRVAIPWGTRQIFALADIPRLPSGKIDYSAVLEQGVAIAADTDIAKRSGQHGGLETVYGKALGRGSVSVDDSFASLGGDSLAYVQVSMAIEAAVGHLPTNWERLTIAEIQALSGGAETSQRKFRYISSEVVIRALSIIAVVAHHSIGPLSWLQGGALALLITAGYNSSRFQRDRLISSRRLMLVWQFAVRFILPYYCVLLVYEVLTPNRMGLPSLLLVNNMIDDAGVQTMIQFWFIQALLHYQIIFLAIFSVAGLRHFAIRQRWMFSLCLFTLAVIAKFSLEYLFPTKFAFRTEMWAYAFALGWVIEAADTMHKRVIAMALALILPILDWSLLDAHVAFAAAAAITILFVPRLWLWSPICRVTALVAQSAYYIYLSQGITIALIRGHLRIYSVPILTLLCVVGGLVFYLVWRSVLDSIRSGASWWRQQRYSAVSG